MFYHYVRMVNCNRFTIMGGYKEVVIRPGAKVQAILGTNGTGKSSLLRVAFTPVPPDPSSFDKPGLWEVHFYHKGREFKLQAKYEDKNSYSFIVDGEELNKGRNVTKMNELAKEHFRYNANIHRLLTDDLRFTEMSTLQRRDWIAQMSTVDFTFAFSEFKRFTQGMNKAKILRGEQQRRINEETEKLIPDEDLLQLRARGKELREALDMLMREPKSDAKGLPEHELHYQFDNVMADVEAALMLEYPPVPDGDASWEELLEDAKTEVANLHGAVKVRAEIVTTLEQKLRRVEALMSNDPKELQATQDELQEALSKLPAVSIDMHESLLVKAPDAIAALRASIGQLPGTYVSMASVSDLQEQVYQKRVQLGKVTGLMDDILRQINHMDNCQSVTCPACSHTFKPGVDPAVLETLRARSVNGEGIQNKLTSELSEQEEQLDNATRSSRSFQELDEIKHRYQGKYPGLFAYIDQVGGFELGKGLLAKLAVYEREVLYVDQKQQLFTRLESVKTALSQYEQESGDYVELKKQYAEAVTEYEALIKHHSEARNLRDQLAAKLGHCNDYSARFHHAMDLYENLRENLITYCDDIGDQMIEEMISSTHRSLGVVEQALFENDLTLGILKDLRKQLDIACVEEIAYTALYDAMSPKTGLIAEQISHQIGALVGGVNQMIARVWGYPLYLTVGEVTEDGVDYKFPMVSNGKPRDDISHGSASMKSIINQAFRLLAYYCFDYVSYPLFLDELGGDFDDVHRQNLTGWMKELAENDRFSQIFMIHHRLEGESAFPNSEAIILDDANIDFRHPYNQHVEFA